MKAKMLVVILSVTFLPALFLVTPSKAQADCGDITRQIFNVEVGGLRTYLDNLPKGISMVGEQAFGDGTGVDVMTGKAVGLTLRTSSAIWRNDRVFMFSVQLQGTSEDDIENAERTFLSIANTGFSTNPKSPEIKYLRCNDGLKALITRAHTTAIPGRIASMPVLVLSVNETLLRSGTSGYSLIVTSPGTRELRSSGVIRHPQNENPFPTLVQRPPRRRPARASGRAVLFLRADRADDAPPRAGSARDAARH